MEKTCYKCRVAKPVTEFTNDKKTKDGYCRACKDCRREIRKKSYVKNNTAQKQTEARRRLQDWVCQFKTKCENCSETHPACLDFHHEGEKYAGISVLVNKYHADDSMKEKIVEEIEKCIVLCANCHRKLHWEKRRNTVGPRW